MGELLRRGSHVTVTHVISQRLNLRNSSLLGLRFGSVSEMFISRSNSLASRLNLNVVTLFGVVPGGGV